MGYTTSSRKYRRIGRRRPIVGRAWVSASRAETMTLDDLPQSVALALCVAGVWLTWTAHDYLQERVFRAPGFHFGFTMAFCLQFVSFLLSACSRAVEWMLTRSGAEARRQEAEEQAQRQREAVLEQGLLGHKRDEAVAAEEAEEEEEEEEEQENKPVAAASWWILFLYLALSLLIAAANGCATAALNYVSMQTKVLFKSSKIVTVMLLGRLFFGRRYLLSEYGFMLLVVLGLAAFLLASSAAATAKAAQHGASVAGVALLAIAILADSLVPNLQQKLLQGAGRPKQEMIFHTNWCSALMTLAYALATGEAALAAPYLARRPRVLGLLLLQSVAGYLGIVTYLETVKRYGSKVTVVVTSCRKLFTIALSSLAFHHPLTGFHLAGIAAVFLGVLLNAERERRCARVVVGPAVVLLCALVALELRPWESLGEEVKAEAEAEAVAQAQAAPAIWLRWLQGALQARLL